MWRLWQKSAIVRRSSGQLVPCRLSGRPFSGASKPQIPPQLSDYLQSKLSKHKFVDRDRFYATVLKHLEPIHGSTMTVEQLQSFSGLDSLADAVARDFHDSTEEKIPVVFVLPHSTAKVKLSFYQHATLLETSQQDRIVAEFLEGSCGGNASCSSCHVYIDDNSTAQLTQPSKAEKDMLDCAFEVQDNSRLACQVRWIGSDDDHSQSSKKRQKLIVHIPTGVNDMWK